MSYSKFIFTVFTFLVLTSLNASAYITGQLSYGTLDYSQRTHILVTGVGKELGTQFQGVAIAKGTRIRELFPDEQIFMISMTEIKLKDNVHQLELRGLQILNADNDSLTEKRLFKELRKFNQIASISFFGHSAAHVGLLLENKLDRMNYTSEHIPTLKGHFTEDAYAQLYSCNSGFYLAPKIAQLWGIPVAGSLTSTDFEKLYDDGQWYVNNPGRHPTTGGWASINSQSYREPMNCLGTCIRMRPDNFPYNGYWGQYYDGFLPFYKFFCPNISEERCAKTMAKAMLSQVSIKPLTLESKLADFRSVASDILCPNNKDGTLRKSCMASLETAYFGDKTLENYSPSKRQSLKCDAKACKFTMACEEMHWLLPFPRKCQIDNPISGSTNTLFNEFKMYIKGFELLRAEKGITEAPETKPPEIGKPIDTPTEDSGEEKANPDTDIDWDKE